MEKVKSSKFEVEKFNGKNKFELWNLKMQQANNKSGDG
jgi:hypothetical protein